MAKSALLSRIVEVSEEVSSEELENKSGGGFIKTGGVYDVTIEEAFITETKKGGLQLDIFFGGDNLHNHTLYIASNKKNPKTKKNELITTYQLKGKTVSLHDYKIFKQLMFLATETPQGLEDIDVEEATIKYKSYGKDIEVEAERVTALIGKNFKIALRQEEQYGYDKEAKETDKTCLKVDSDGDIVYALSLMDVFSENGFTPVEVIKGEEETKTLDSKIEFLSGDKAIKTVTLEMPEEGDEDTEEDYDDEVDF